VYTKGAAQAVGDYWTIGVRPSTPQIILPARLGSFQRPDGPRRWLAPLAVIAWSGPKAAEVTDCRPPFLDLVDLTTRKSGCELVVAPGESIQAAINSLPRQGGAVCLKAGTHKVRQTINIDKSRVTLHGESGGTVVAWDGPAASGPQNYFVNIKAASQLILTHVVDQTLSDVVVRDIAFLVTAVTNAPASFLDIQQGISVEIRACRFICQNDVFLSTGIEAGQCRDLTVAENVFQNVMSGILISDCLGQTTIERNVLLGPTSTVTIDGNPVEVTAGVVGVSMINIVNTAVTGPGRIEQNLIENFGTGINVTAGSERSSIAGNTIRRGLSNPLTGDLPALADMTKLLAYLDTLKYAIACAANQSVIRGNRIDLRASRWGGIRTAGRNTLVEANLIESLISDQETWVPAGIYCAALNVNNTAHHALVRDNVLQGVQAGITVSSCDGVQVSRNYVDGGSRAWYGLRMDSSSDTLVADNQLGLMLIQDGYAAVFVTGGDRNRIVGNRIDSCVAGIFAGGQAELEIGRNHVTRASQVGIWLSSFSGSATLSENRVINCGFSGPVGQGILAFGMGTPTVNLRVTGCEIIDTGMSGDEDLVSVKIARSILAAGLGSCQVTGNRVGYTDLEKVDPTLLRQAVSVVGLGLLGPEEKLAGQALVSDNSLGGTGGGPDSGTQNSSMVRVAAFRKVTFSDNICRHLVALQEGDAAPLTVELEGNHLIVMGNHIDANDSSVNSISLDNRSKAVVIGNVTSGLIIDVASTVPSQYLDFNPRM
jgi:nitrous oxidase accessory protein NosD